MTEASGGRGEILTGGGGEARKKFCGGESIFSGRRAAEWQWQSVGRRAAPGYHCQGAVAAPAGTQRQDNHTTYSPFIIISFSFLAPKSFFHYRVLLYRNRWHAAPLAAVLAGASFFFFFFFEFSSLLVTGRGRVGAGRGNEEAAELADALECLRSGAERRRGGGRDGKNVSVSNELTAEDKQARGLSFSPIVAPFIRWLNSC